jgi:hypothetical protein
MQKEVRIVPREEYPFKIVTSNARYGTDIAFQLIENKIDESTEYLLKVRNLKKEKGVYRDRITLRTNSEVKPKITIRIYVRISEKDQENRN